MDEDNGSLCLGIDVGTTSIKAAAYDHHGGLISSAQVENEVTNTQPGWCSQSMHLTWENTLQAIKELSEQIDPGKVESIGVCAQGDGLWLLDEHHAPVRNAILWNDQRANSYVEKWIEDGTSNRLTQYSRTAIWAGTSGAIYRWLLDHEPDNAARARYSIHCKDWINLKLTGNLTADFTDATIPFLDLEKGEYAAQAFEMLGLQDMRGKFVRPQKSSSLNGQLNESLAVETGLTPGIPVSAGSLDVAAMTFGMELDKTGDVFVILGTTAVVGVVIDAETFSEPPVGATVSHPCSNKWLRVLAPLSGASALDWFTSMDPTNFGGDDASIVAGKLNAAASNSPPGSNGVVFLPFLNGERAPFVAPNAKASIVGVTAATTQADLARSVMEGVAFSLRHCFASTGQPKPKKVFLTGGGAKNRLWCDIIANVMGITAVASEESDHGTWGAAKLGAIAAGTLKLSHHQYRNQHYQTHTANPTITRSYDNLYQRYLTHVENAQFLWSKGANGH